MLPWDLEDTRDIEADMENASEIEDNIDDDKILEETAQYEDLSPNSMVDEDNYKLYN